MPDNELLLKIKAQVDAAGVAGQLGAESIAEIRKVIDAANSIGGEPFDAAAIGEQFRKVFSSLGAELRTSMESGFEKIDIQPLVSSLLEVARLFSNELGIGAADAARSMRASLGNDTGSHKENLGDLSRHAKEGGGPRGRNKPQVDVVSEGAGPRDDTERRETRTSLNRRSRAAGRDIKPGEPYNDLVVGVQEAEANKATRDAMAARIAAASRASSGESLVDPQTVRHATEVQRDTARIRSTDPESLQNILGTERAKSSLKLSTRSDSALTSGGTQEVQALIRVLEESNKAIVDLNVAILKGESGLGKGGGGRGRGVDPSNVHSGGGGPIGTLGSALGGYRRGQGAAHISGIGGLPGALAGGALFNVGFAVQNGLMQAFSAATQLNRQLVQLQANASAIGQGNQFPALRDSILSVADATGIAGTDVAALATEFLGLYQNAMLAASATQSAAQFVAESGVDATTASPQLAALASIYGLTVKQIGNAVITASQASGRSQGDILAAASDAAPVTKQAGFTANETFGLITATTQGTALSGGDSGQALTKIISALQTNISTLAHDGIHFDAAALAGNIPEALRNVVQSYAGLTPATQAVVGTALGGTKSAQFVASLGTNPQALADLNKDYTNNNALATQFAASQATVSAALNRLKESASGLAETLLNGGIGQALVTVASDGADMLRFVEDAIGLFNRFSNDLGGVPAKLLEVALAVGVLNRAGAFSAGSKIIQGLGDATALGAGKGAGRAVGSVVGFFGNPATRTAAKATASAAETSAAQQEALVKLMATRDAAIAQLEVWQKAQVAGETSTASEIEGTDLLTAAIAAQTDVRVASNAVTEAGIAVKAEDAAANVADAATAGGTKLAGAAGGATRLLPAAAADAPALIGPQAIALGAAAAVLAVSAALSSRSGSEYRKQIAGTQASLGNLSDAQLQTIQAGGKATTTGGDTVQGSSDPLAKHTKTLGYAADAVVDAIPVAGQAALALQGLGHLVGVNLTPGGLLSKVPGVGGLFGGHSESSEQMAADEERSRAFTGGSNAGGLNVLKMSDASVTAVASVLNGTQAKALTAAQAQYEKTGKASDFRKLQNLYGADTVWGSAGAGAVATNRVATARQNALASEGDNAGDKFTSIGDISSAFTAGTIGSVEALKDMKTVIDQDSTATAASTQQKLVDQAALATFKSSLETAAAAINQTTDQYIAGNDALQLFHASVATFANSPNLDPTDVQTQAAQIAQQTQAANDQAIALTPYDPKAQAAALLNPSLITRQTTVSAADALRINANDASRGAAPQYANVQAAVDKNTAITAANEAARRTNIALDHSGQGGARENDNVPLGAIPAGVSTLSNAEQVTQASALAQTQQALTAENIASATVQGQTQDQLAAIQTAGDTATLKALTDAQNKAGKNSALGVLLEPQIVAATAQLSADQEAAIANHITTIQQQTATAKSRNFMDPVGNAKAEMNQGQNEAKAMGTTIQKLQALQDSGATLTSQQQQALTDYYSGVSDLFSAAQANAAALVAAVQAGQTFTPLLADATAVAGATKAITNGTNVGGLGLSISQLKAMVANGTANATQSAAYGTYETSSAQQTTDTNAIATQGSTNVAQLAAAKGQTVTAAQDSINTTKLQIAQLAAQNATAANNTQMAQLQGQLATEIQAGTDAQTALVQANLAGRASVQTALGNAVGAAQSNVEAAVKQLAADTAKGQTAANSANYVTDAAKAQAAAANLVTTQATTASTLVTEEVGNNQASIAQGINVLKEQMNKYIAEGDQYDAEGVRTAIQSLINQGNQNASFNLPSNIAIPTLYEVRRTEATPTGGTYNDNKQVNVAINIGNGVDTQAAVNTLMQAMGGPATVGLNSPTP